MKYIIHEKILQKLSDVSERLSSSKRFSFSDLSVQLNNYLEKELRKVDPILYRKYNEKDEQRKGLNKRTLIFAWSRKGEKNDGALEELCRLLCYFGFKGEKFENVLINEGYTLAQLGEETLRIRSEHQKTEQYCNDDTNNSKEIDLLKKEYFNYLQNDCGYIKFEGAPKYSAIEDIFVTPYFSSLWNYKNSKGIFHERPDYNDPSDFSGICTVEETLLKENRIAVIADPGGGKTTLLNSIAISCAFPERGKKLFHDWKDESYFPVFIRCSELYINISSSILDYIQDLTRIAIIKDYNQQFEKLIY